MLSLKAVKLGVIGPFYRILCGAVVLGSFCAFGWVLADVIRSAEGLRPNLWFPIAVAVALYCFMLLFLMILWERILIQVGTPNNHAPFPPRLRLYTAYSRSWLARYIPGRIWSLAGRTLLVNRSGVPANDVAHSVVIEVVFTYGMVTIISGSILCGAYLHPLVAIATFIVGTMFFAATLIMTGRLAVKDISQPVDYSVIRKTLRRVANRVSGRSFFSLAFTLKGIAFYSCYSFMQLSFIVLIAAAFADLDTFAIAVIAGAWGISLTVGWLSILPPVGLGARDGLAFLLFSQVIDVSSAGSIVVTSRIVMLATDLAFVAAIECLASGLTRIPPKIWHSRMP